MIMKTNPCSLLLRATLLLRVFTVAFLSVISATAFSQTSWTLRNPLPTNENLRSVAWSGSQLVSVGHSGVIFTSNDAITWTKRTSGVTTTLNNIIFAGSQYVAVGDAGVVLTSPDGVTWTKRTTGTTQRLCAAAWTGATIVVAGDAGTIITSPTGAVWTARFSSVGTNLNAAVWTGSNVVVVGDSGVTLTSSNGLAWSLASANATITFSGIAFDGSNLIATTQGGTIFTSANGITWTLRHTAAQSLNAITWTGTQAIAVGAAGTIVTSPDTLAWTTQTSGVSTALSGVVGTGAQQVVAGEFGTLLTSPTGVTWVNQSQIAGINLRDVAWTGLEMIAVGTTGTALTSANGDSWTAQSTGTTQDLEAATWTGSEVIAVGASGTILATAHGTSWSARASGTTQRLLGVTWSHSLIIAVGENGTILTSPDGVTWTTRASGTTAHLRGVAANGNTIIAVGDGGMVDISITGGVSWFPMTIAPFANLSEATWTGAQFVAVGDTDTILTSPNGTTWTQRAASFGQNLQGVAWSGSSLIAVGTRELIATSPTGVTWTRQTTPSPTLPHLRSVEWFGTRAVAVGDAGTILTSGNAPAPAPVVSLSVASQSVLENVGTVTVNATLSFAPTTSLTIPFSLAGTTATSGADFTITATPLTFTAGQTSKTISINVINDVLAEGPEDVRVAIGNPALALVGTLNVFTLTIHSDDIPPGISTQPTHRIVAAGSPSTTFSVLAGGSPPLSYRWRKAGVNISGATASNYTISNVQLSHAGAYTVLVSNPTSSVVSTPAELAVVDTSASTVLVPVGGTIRISVAAAGNALTYLWHRNGTPMANDVRTTGVTTPNLVMTGATTGDNAIYTCKVTAPGGFLFSGNKTLQVLLPPVVTTASLPNTMVSAALSLPLAATNSPNKWTVSGLPPGVSVNTATGIITGRATAAGQYVVQVQATNLAGPSPIVRLTLTVQSLPTGSVGSFIALADRHASVNNNLGSRIDFTTQSTGTFSGTLVQNGITYRFSGALNSAYNTNPQLLVTIPRAAPQPALLLNLTLDGFFDAALGTLTASTSNVPVSGFRRVFNSTTRPANTRVGYHSFALDIPSIDVGNPAYPQGSGFGTATVALDGGITVAGRLADGSSFGSSGFVGGNGQIAIYQSLTSNLGSLLGTLTQTPDPGPDFANNTVAGTLTWTRPASSSRTYPAGIVQLPLTVFGKYLAPSASTPAVLGLPVSTSTAQLRFSEGGLAFASINPDIASWTYTDALKVILPTAGSPSNPGKDTLVINPRTGAISGTFTLVDGSLVRTVSYTGMTVRPASGFNQAVGYFLLPQIPIGTQTISTSPILSGQVRIVQ